MQFSGRANPTLASNLRTNARPLLRLGNPTFVAYLPSMGNFPSVSPALPASREQVGTSPHFDTPGARHYVTAVILAASTNPNPGGQSFGPARSDPHGQGAEGPGPPQQRPRAAGGLILRARQQRPLEGLRR